MGCLLSYCFGPVPVPHQQPPEDELTNKNILFYSNEILCQPDGDYIDYIHRQWFNDYKKLEKDHAFIQWLFPLPERGMNLWAQPLHEEEVEWFKSNEDARRRLMKSYEMMLGFYGISMGAGDELSRSVNWENRFQNLQHNQHNNLRITRIVRCMVLLGFEHQSVRFVKFLANEIYYERTLMSCRYSCENFWIPALTPEQQTQIRQFVGRASQAE